MIWWGWRDWWNGRVALWETFKEAWRASHLTWGDSVEEIVWVISYGYLIYCAFGPWALH